MRCEEDDLLSVGERGGDQFVALVDADRDNTARHDVREILELGLLHRAIARGEENISARFFQIAHCDHGADGFSGLQADEIADVFALAGGAHIGSLVHLEPVHASGVGEDQNVGMGRGNE